MMEVHYEGIRSNDQSQNISQIIFNKSKSNSLVDIQSSQHYYGANARQNLFTLNEDIQNMHKRCRNDSEIIDSSIITSIKQQKDLEVSQGELDRKKNKGKIPSNLSPMKDNIGDLIKTNSNQNGKQGSSVEEIQDNLQNIYDLKDSKRLQINSDFNSSPNQQGALLAGSKLQRISLQPLQRESIHEGQQKTARYSNRPSHVLMNFFARMKISQITKRFMNKIKSYSQKYNYSRLTKKHYDIINDKSAFFNEHKIQDEQKSNRSALSTQFTELIVVMYEYLDRFSPFNPESSFSVVCDLIYGLILLGYLFVIPIQLSFRVTFELFELIVFIVFIINFLLTMNKCYYYQGRIIYNRKKILINFMQTSFFIDVAVFISIRLQMFQYVAFLKFFDINKIIKRADNHFQIIRRIPIAFSLINLVVKMALIAQIAGCTFHFVARSEMENGQEKTWLSAQNMTENSWQNRYVISIYFAFITMMTVGYGDVTPVNNQERIYVIFMTLLSSGIFGYVVNTIGQLYHQQAQKQEQFQKRKQEITLYMDTRNIESETKIRVLNYLEYAFQYHKKRDQNPLVLFQDIPSSLVDEVYINYYGKYLLQNKIMKLNFSECALKALSIRMKEKNLAPNEYLYKKGMQESKVYFIVSGTVEVILEGKDQSKSFESISKQGDEIGLRSAFVDQARSTSVMCSKDQNCSVVYFEMEDFKNILTEFPKDKERFCELRDDIIYNSNTLDTKCASCHRYDHYFSKCPLISLNICKENYIYRYNNNGEPQIRKHCQRRGRKLNCLIQHEEYRQKLKQFRMSLVYLIIPEMKENRPNLQLFQERSDKFFFNKMPTVKVLEGGDLEADMEEYNIYEGYQTMAHDDFPLHHHDEDEESDSDNNHLKIDEDRILIIQGESGENILGSSSYSSSNNQYNSQQNQQQQQLQIQINPSSVKENIPSSLQNNNTPSNTQKMSLFAKKQSQNIEIPSPGLPTAQNTNNEISSQVQLSQINQASSRNLSFRRERGDSFYPPKRNSKQYSQQRSLQSRAKSARKLSETHQPSNKPSHLQVSFNNDNFQDIVESGQVIVTDLFNYDFDKMKIFEKYFPMYNYNYVINRINKKLMRSQKPKRIHKTIIHNSPKKRHSQKFLKLQQQAILKDEISLCI